MTGKIAAEALETSHVTSDFPRETQVAGINSVIGLHTALDLMQEAAFLMDAVGDLFEDPCHLRYLNKSAAEALAVESGFVDQPLNGILPADTVTSLHVLAQAAQKGGPLERSTSAPDPLNDISGTPVMTMRITSLADFTLCTWIPTWPATKADEETGPPYPHTRSIADRLELASALESPSAGNVGVFSIDLLNGKTLWSAGMHHIFCRDVADDPIDMHEIGSYVETEVGYSAAWRSLIRDGNSMNIEGRLVSRLGSHRFCLQAHAERGADGLPTLVRGSCRLLSS